jgi:hypothetical protein
MDWLVVVVWVGGVQTCFDGGLLESTHVQYRRHLKYLHAYCTLCDTFDSVSTNCHGSEHTMVRINVALASVLQYAISRQVGSFPVLYEPQISSLFS